MHTLHLKTKATLASNFLLYLQLRLLKPHFKTWWRMSGSNRRPPACKAGALPAELIPLCLRQIWWVWMDSNHRPPPYQDGALTSWATDPVKVTITLRLRLCWSIIMYCDCVRTTDKCECLQSRFYSLERRWSSRTFRYGYLVTTSPQSWILPW